MMRPNQILVLSIAVMAGIGAMLMLKRDETSPTAEQIVVTKMLPAETAEILVAATDLPMWQVLRRDDLRWDSWPAQNVPEGAIQRSQRPNAELEIRGMMTRSQFAGGEPLRVGRLMESSSEAGFLSAILPPGKRALAITIDTRGATSAGGFIHPNDRVDIIRVYREEDRSDERPSNVFYSETLLTNIRVLAIGQSVETDTESISLHADTATVEVTPAQAEALTLAQRTGPLTLSLRSFADAQLEDTISVPPRAITVTAGGSAGFSTARFAIAQRPVAQKEPANPPVIPVSRHASELVSARWLELPFSR
jgi:pilus assembly protein CpaB